MASGNSREKLGRSGVAGGHCMVVRTESYAPNRHDTGSTSPRSVGEVTLIRDTISHYSPVLIAPLSNLPRAGVQKKRAHRRREPKLPASLPAEGGDAVRLFVQAENVR